MVRIIISIVIYAISLVGSAQSGSSTSNIIIQENTFTVNIVMDKISSDQGKIYFGLYESQENFNRKMPLMSANTKIKNGMVKVDFKNLNPGIYVVTCFHDLNDNGKIDFDSTGRPTEDYGMTNNVMSFGPPRFEEGKFALNDKDLTFEIKI